MNKLPLPYSLCGLVLLAMFLGVQAGCESPLVRSFHGLGETGIVVPGHLDGPWHVPIEDSDDAQIKIESSDETGFVHITFVGAGEHGLLDMADRKDGQSDATYSIRHVEHAGELYFDATAYPPSRGDEVLLETHLLGKFVRVGDCVVYWLLGGDDVLELVASNNLEHVVRPRLSKTGFRPQDISSLLNNGRNVFDQRVR